MPQSFSSGNEVADVWAKKGIEVSVTRGDGDAKVIDSRTNVAIGLVSAENETLALRGQKEFTDLVSMRSTGKPFMTAALIHCGAADFFDLQDKHLAITAGSHLSEKDHTAPVKDLRIKINKKFESLGFGEHFISSGDLKNTADEVRDKKGEIDKVADGKAKIKHWCSGQHMGLVGAALYLEIDKLVTEKGYSTQINRQASPESEGVCANLEDHLKLQAGTIKSYRLRKGGNAFEIIPLDSFQRPIAQQKITSDSEFIGKSLRATVSKQLFEAFCRKPPYGVDVQSRLREAVKNYYKHDNAVHSYYKKFLREGLGDENLTFLTDGCNSGSITTPLDRAAYGYARLAAVEKENESRGVGDIEAAFARAGKAMLAYPNLLHGAKGFDSKLGKLGVISKWGVDGLHCMAVRGKDGAPVGIALKVESGKQQQAFNTAVRVLQRLGVLNENQLERPPWDSTHDGNQSSPLADTFTVTKNRSENGVTSGITKIEFNEESLAFLKDLRERLWRPKEASVVPKAAEVAPKEQLAEELMGADVAQLPPKAPEIITKEHLAQALAAAMEAQTPQKMKTGGDPRLRTTSGYPTGPIASSSMAR